MLVISIDNRPYKVLEVLKYYPYGRVLLQTELGPFTTFRDDVYVL